MVGWRSASSPTYAPWSSPPPGFQCTQATFQPLLRAADFNPAEAEGKDVERVMVWMNDQRYKEWTKHDLKLTLRKFIQYAKWGSCDGKTPLPPEVSWVSLTVREKVPASRLSHSFHCELHVSA